MFGALNCVWQDTRVFFSIVKEIEIGKISNENLSIVKK